MAIAKVYVDVIVYYDKDGNITPLEIIWKNGKRYEIDKVLDMQKMASRKAGGIGIRYTVRISGQDRFLYHEMGEGDKWFVESKEIYVEDYEGPASDQ